MIHHDNSPYLSVYISCHVSVDIIQHNNSPFWSPGNDHSVHVNKIILMAIDENYVVVYILESYIGTAAEAVSGVVFVLYEYPSRGLVSHTCTHCGPIVICSIETVQQTKH